MYPLLPMLNLVYRGPGSVDVTQDINQDVEVVGHKETEIDIYRHAASPGKQLGRLTDAVLELDQRVSGLIAQLREGKSGEELKDGASEAIQELQKIFAKVEPIKKMHEDRLRETAKESMEKLCSTNKDAYRSLIRELQAKGAD